MYFVYISPVFSCRVTNTIPDISVVAGVKLLQDTMMQMLTKMMDRLNHLESERATPLAPVLINDKLEAPREEIIQVQESQ